MRRQPHVYVQGPILLSDLFHVIDSHGESSAGHHRSRLVVGCDDKKALAPGNGRHPLHDNRGGRRNDGTRAVPARKVAFSRDAPTRQVSRKMLTPNDIDQIAERTYFHVVVIVCLRNLLPAEATDCGQPTRS